MLVLRCGLAGVVWCGIRMQAEAAFKRRPVTAEEHFKCQVSQGEIYGGQIFTGTDFFPCTRVFSGLHNSIKAPYLSSFTRCSYPKDKRPNPGNLPENKVLSEVENR